MCVQGTNSLSGTIISDLASLPALQRVLLGKIKKRFSRRIARLHLQETAVPRISLTFALFILPVAENDFTGILPDELWTMTQLTSLTISKFLLHSQ